MQCCDERSQTKDVYTGRVTGTKGQFERGCDEQKAGHFAKEANLKVKH